MPVEQKSLQETSPEFTAPFASHFQFTDVFMKLGTVLSIAICWLVSSPLTAGELPFRVHEIGQPGGVNLGQTSAVEVDKDGDLDFISGWQEGDVFSFENQGIGRWPQHQIGEAARTDVEGVALDAIAMAGSTRFLVARGLAILAGNASKNDGNVSKTAPRPRMTILSPISMATGVGIWFPCSITRESSGTAFPMIRSNVGLSSSWSASRRPVDMVESPRVISKVTETSTFRASIAGSKVPMGRSEMDPARRVRHW